MSQESDLEIVRSIAGPADVARCSRCDELAECAAAGAVCINGQVIDPVRLCVPCRELVIVNRERFYMGAGAVWPAVGGVADLIEEEELWRSRTRQECQGTVARERRRTRFFAVAVAACLVINAVLLVLLLWR